MSKRVKQLETAVLADRLRQVHNCVLVGYKGLTAQGAVELRRTLRARKIRLHVVKNSLAGRAFEAAGKADLARFLDAETAIAIAPDPVSAPKALEEWRKQHAVLELRGGLVEGKTVDAAQIRQVAQIPSREVLLSRLLGSIQAPARGLAGVLTGLPRNLLYGLKAWVEKKEAEGPGA